MKQTTKLAQLEAEVALSTYLKTAQSCVAPDAGGWGDIADSS